MKNVNISIILIIGMIAVSTSPVSVKILNQYENVNGIMLAFWRMSIAAMFLWIYSCIINFGSFKTRKNLITTNISGFFLGVHFALFFIALDLTKMANATFLGTLTPVFTLLLEILYLKRSFSFTIYLGLVLAMIGATVIFFGSSSISFGIEHLWGNLLALSCALVLAVSFLISEKIRKTEPTTIYTRTLYTSASVTILLIAILFDNNIFPMNNHVFLLLGCIYLALIPTLLGHNLFYYSMKYINPTIVASVPLSEPVIASGIGLLIFPILGIENQIFTENKYFTILGGFITLLGIFIILKKKK